MIGPSEEFIERELKFMVKDHGLEALTILALKHGATYQPGNGQDTYYVHPDMPQKPPVRHRMAESFGELTVKKQLVDGINDARTEVNVSLKNGQEREVPRLLELLGYTPALQIQKVSHNYYFPFIVASVYTVFDPFTSQVMSFNGKPARFAEIELREDKNWSILAKDENLRKGLSIVPTEFILRIYGGKYKTKTFCETVLNSWAHHLSERGIITGSPLTESLWDMFGRPWN